MFFWNRDWREKSWKLFGAGWAGRWTDIKVTIRVPWTKERNPPAPHLARNSRAGSNLTLQIAIVSNEHTGEKKKPPTLCI